MLFRRRRRRRHTDRRPRVRMLTRFLSRSNFQVSRPAFEKETEREREAFAARGSPGPKVLPGGSISAVESL